ncbi:MAG TPA: VOC family protein [Gammaproteobacteria bacterium]|nr:VOC family protein [Gammaproteobacteria bacterium]
MKDIPRFHLAFPVRDLEEARHFYSGLLGCPTGRESNRWIDFDFFGHQIVAHQASPESAASTNQVDGEDVPVRHFGVILEWDQWQALADKLKRADVKFVIEPGIRFKGQVGEQATLFFKDPSGNALELKSFRDASQIFAKDQ